MESYGVAMQKLLAPREDFSNLYFLSLVFLYLSALVIIAILIPAAFNLSLGVLNIYVRCLLFFFEWGRKKASFNRKLAKENSHLQQKNGASFAEVRKVQFNELESSVLLPTNQFSASEDETTGSDLNDLIEKKNSIGLVDYCRQLYEPCYERLISDQHFDLTDISFYIKAGIDSLVQDDVTQRFLAEELKCWNFLTRTNHIYKHNMGFRLSVLWIVGFWFRYSFLFPIRAVIFIIGVCSYAYCTLLMSCIPDSKLKDILSKRFSLMSFRILCRGFSAVVRFHNRENLPRGGGVCVANHTSPIDALILSCDNCYVLVGQRHGGFTGFMQNAMSKLASHVWFERSQQSDRKNVIRRIMEHASDPEKTPILIFPEGTCINNTSVMMFRKGSFEYSDLIYPVAIKYDPRFGDAFWNSSKHSMLRYLLYMMTSWAIVCDVWYLPPVRRNENEDVVSFAYRVKRLIAERGGLVDLEWDGNLKRSPVNPQHLDKLKQKTFALSRNSSSYNSLNESFPVNVQSPVPAASVSINDSKEKPNRNERVPPPSKEKIARKMCDFHKRIQKYQISSQNTETMAYEFSNQDLLRMLQMLKRSFNPGSEITGYMDFKKINWNAVAVDCQRSVQECRSAFATYVLEISPHRNAHEILSLAESRLQPAKHFEVKFASSSSAEIYDENSQSVPLKPVKGVASKKNMNLPKSVMQPLSPLHIFIARTCERTETEESSLTKGQWKEKFENLKTEKKVKYIKMAIRDDIRFQQELNALNDKTIEIPDRFINILKKELELFMQHNGFEKIPTSGYGLYIAEVLSGTHKDENANLQQRMKDVAVAWKNLPTIKQQEYNLLSRRQRDERMQNLKNASPEIVAVQDFFKRNVNSASVANNAAAVAQKRKMRIEKIEKESASVPSVVDENSMANFSPIKTSPKKQRRQSEVDFSAGNLSPIV